MWPIRLIQYLLFQLVTLAYYIIKFTINPINLLEILTISAITFPVVAGAVLVFVRYKSGVSTKCLIIYNSKVVFPFLAEENFHSP